MRQYSQWKRTFTQVLYVPVSTSSPLQSQGEYYIFHSTTLIWQLHFTFSQLIGSCCEQKQPTSAVLEMLKKVGKIPGLAPKVNGLCSGQEEKKSLQQFLCNPADQASKQASNQQTNKQSNTSENNH